MQRCYPIDPSGLPAPDSLAPHDDPDEYDIAVDDGTPYGNAGG